MGEFARRRFSGIIFKFTFCGRLLAGKKPQNAALEVYWLLLHKA